MYYPLKDCRKFKKSVLDVPILSKRTTNSGPWLVTFQITIQLRH